MLLQVLLYIHACAAVKEWMFRKCSQNPFCARQLDYAEHPEPGRYEAVDVDVSDSSNITGSIRKTITEIETENAIGAIRDGQKAYIDFPFYLELVSDDVYRFVVDEKVRQAPEGYDMLKPERFSPADWVLLNYTHKPESVHLDSSFNGFAIGLGENSVRMQYKPFKLEFLHRNEPVLTFNGEGAFNIEHQRTQSPTDPRNWWASKFDSYNEKYTRGPESIGMDVEFHEFEHVFGIPEHADSLSLRDTRFPTHEPYRLYNVDIFQYETSSVMPLYGAIPFMLAQKPNNVAAGVFWLNSADTYVDVYKEYKHIKTHWVSESGKLDVFAIMGETVRDVEARYGQLTGTLALPPMFALGYHQCRWNYWTQDEVLQVDKTMDLHRMPYDVIWLDIEWTQKRKYFKWNDESFPDPGKMLESLDAKHRKLVVLNDPHVSVNEEYDAYKLVKHAAIMNQKGTKPYEAHCWPGRSIWIDGFNPEAGSVWSQLCALGTDIGRNATNLYLWSDMSEPSVFSGPESTAHKDVLHYGGWQHRDVHNLYGQTIFNMTTEALNSRYNHTQRPFVLTRSFFAGSQRIGPAWTGDNQAEWRYLESSIPTVLSLGLAGMPFVGADVGGFFKNPDDELLVRWYQLGVFYPFFREHAHEDSEYREPYLLEDQRDRDAVRAALRLRYQLLPEFYTLFYESSVELKPILRPLVYEFPEDKNCYDVEKEFMLGSKLLVAPVTLSGAKEAVITLPAAYDNWYEFFSGSLVPGSPLQIGVGRGTIPVFMRGGSVLFTKNRPRRNTFTQKNDPYTLTIAVNKDGTATGYVYIDDGDSYDHENGKYVKFEVELDKDGLHGRALHTAPQFNNLYIETIKFYGGKFSETSYARLESQDESYLLRMSETSYGFSISNPKLPVTSDWFVRLY